MCDKCQSIFFLIWMIWWIIYSAQGYLLMSVGHIETINLLISMWPQGPRMVQDTCNNGLQYMLTCTLMLPSVRIILSARYVKSIIYLTIGKDQNNPIQLAYTIRSLKHLFLYWIKAAIPPARFYKQIWYKSPVTIDLPA